MYHQTNKNEIRKARHERMRFTLKGTVEKPRLNVYRSLKHIYVQIIDDTAFNKNGNTIVSACTAEKEFEAANSALNKTQAAKEVGKIIAQRAIEKGVKEVVFDRGGYLYTGRVAAVAEGAREAGLEF